MDIIRRVKELNLPNNSYVVVGSGAMDVLGIREANDVDLVVSPEVYEKLKQERWEEEVQDDEFSNDGKRRILKKGIYEAMFSWDNQDNKPNLNDLMKDANVVEGIPFVNVKRLMEWKKRKGRNKDMADVELIQKYLNDKIND